MSELSNLSLVTSHKISVAKYFSTSKMTPTDAVPISPLWLPTGRQV